MDYDDQVIMEYAPFSTYLSENLPGSLALNLDFGKFISGELPFQYSKGTKYGEMLFQYADLMMWTLPAPRY